MIRKISIEYSVATSVKPVLSQDLLKQAKYHFDRAMSAQRRGDWALYGEEIRKLSEVFQSAR